MDTNGLWKVFETTGRVEDYLRYRDAVMSAVAKKGEPQDGFDSKRPDPPRTCGG